MIEEIKDYEFENIKKDKKFFDNLKSKFSDTLPFLFTTAVCAGLVFGAFKLFKPLWTGEGMGYQNRDQCKSLINKCYSKASGEDTVLDFAEGINMTRGLGYQGAISPASSISLKQCGGHAHLVISGKRERDRISIGQMESYLGSTDLLNSEEKNTLNSKYQNVSRSNNMDNNDNKDLGLSVTMDPITGKPSVGINMGPGTYDPMSGEIKMGPTIDF